MPGAHCVGFVKTHCGHGSKCEFFILVVAAFRVDRLGRRPFTSSCVCEEELWFDSQHYKSLCKHIRDDVPSECVLCAGL